MATPTADPADVSSQTRRQLRIDQKFVLLPINNESLSRRVRLVKNGRVLRSFTASLGLPAQWWAHLDVSMWRGQTLALSVESDDSPSVGGAKIPGRGASETDDAELVAAIRTSAEIWSPDTLYTESLRPVFHFTSRRGWINDPNGLMYHAGQYHLFFQHNPYGVCWGNMHWGHAVSTDLVHWKELPIALYPHGDGDFPFSGGGVVDHENTSGWGEKRSAADGRRLYQHRSRRMHRVFAGRWRNLEGIRWQSGRTSTTGGIQNCSGIRRRNNGSWPFTANGRAQTRRRPSAGGRFPHFRGPQVLAGTQLDRRVLRMSGSLRSACRWRRESHEVGAELRARLLLHRGV